MKRIILFAIGLICAFFFAGCGDDIVKLTPDDFPEKEEVVKEIKKAEKVLPADSLPADSILRETVLGSWDHCWMMGFVGDTLVSTFCGVAYSWVFDKDGTGKSVSEGTDDPFLWAIQDGYLDMKINGQSVSYAIWKLNDSTLQFAEAAENPVRDYEIIVAAFGR